MSKRMTSASVIVVSGGAKGITARCVVRMAEQYQCKFILLGRSSIEGEMPAYAQGEIDEGDLKRQIMADLSAQGEKPTPIKVQKLFKGIMSRREIEGTLSDIEQAGAQAVYLSVDITDLEGLRASIGAAAEELGAVTGILHGAGNLADKLIEKKTAQDFEDVYAVKVKGLENMLAVCPPEQLEHIILFSSVAGFYGNVGQADYALANDILNKAAHQLKLAHPDCYVISINWGPWDGGMVTPALKSYFAEMGIKVIPIPVGAQMLIDELEGKHGEAVQVLVGSSLARVSPILDEELRTHRLRRWLTLEQNVFLADHVVGGKAVLPIVCSLVWIANGGEQLYPGYKFLSCENVKVLKGVVFDETLANEYVLELQETSKGNGQIAFKALIFSPGKSLPRYHYSADLYLQEKKEPPALYPNVDLSETHGIPGTLLYEDGTLFHGPRFQGVERVLNLTQTGGTGKLTMRCIQPSVPEWEQGQFPTQAFNYYMADIGFQSMGIWARRIYDAGSLPLSCQLGKHYRDVPLGGTFYVSLEVLSHSTSSLVADVYVHDEQGLLYAKLTGAEITLSKNLNALFLDNKLPPDVAY